MRPKPNARLIYSTETGGTCPKCGLSQRDCICFSQASESDPVPNRIVAKLRMEKAGRGGKSVTVIYGLPRNGTFLKGLSQELKRTFGAGGAVIEGGVEIQGDLRERVRDLLMKKGYVVKG